MAEPARAPEPADLVAAWAFGSRVLYPVATGLVLVSLRSLGLAP